MKKLKLLALAFVVATTSLFATNVEVPDIPVKQIRSQVADLFKTHDLGLYYDYHVKVTFKFDDQGKIIVLKVNSKNRNVLKYINENMNQKRVETPGKPHRIFIVPLKFEKAKNL